MPAALSGRFFFGPGTPSGQRDRTDWHAADVANGIDDAPGMAVCIGESSRTSGFCGAESASFRACFFGARFPFRGRSGTCAVAAEGHAGLCALSVRIIAECFFKAVFFSGVFSQAFARLFLTVVGGVRKGSPGRPALEIFFAKMLTSRNHVISFRQADVNCGRE